MSISFSKKHRTYLLFSAAVVALTGCAPRHVGFVTNTTVGISADASTAKTSVAYSRDELFVGPAYEDGGIPPVLGTQTTTGKIFENVQHQSLATGDAAIILGHKGKGGAMAILATQITEQQGLCAGIVDATAQSECADTIDKMKTTRAKIASALAERQQCSLNAGCKGDPQISMFGTQTDWGLTLQADTATGVMSKISLGFQRKEATLARIPEKAANGQSFPSMLALFGSDYDVALDKKCWGGAPKQPKAAEQQATGTPGQTGATREAPTKTTEAEQKTVAAGAGTPECAELQSKKFEFGIAQVIATGAAADGIAGNDNVKNAIIGQITKTAAGTDSSGTIDDKVGKDPVDQKKDEAKDTTEERFAELEVDIGNAREAADKEISDDDKAKEIESLINGFGLNDAKSDELSKEGAKDRVAAIAKSYNEAIDKTPRTPENDKKVPDLTKISEFKVQLRDNGVFRKFIIERNKRNA